MAKKQPGQIPTGQTSRGFPGEESRNPKNNSVRRRFGTSPNEGDGNQVDRTSGKNRNTSWDAGVPTNSYPKGSPSDEPDPNRINTTYRVDDGQVPPTTLTSRARSYQIDMGGDPPQPNGDQSEAPKVPKFGTGTNGE